jgi:hypothetical protein
VPGVSEQYNINLRPVIVKPDSSVGYTYLLTDEAGGFFIWNEENANLWRFKGTRLNMADVVERVRTETYDTMEMEQQFYDTSGTRGRGGFYNRAGRSAKGLLR